MPNGYQWLTLSVALAQLAQRLNDPLFTSWTQAQLTIYVQQSLRQFNVLTFQNKTPFVYNSSNLWNSLGLLVGSPRVQTLTDTYCYTQMEAMLLEPMTGGTWTGTSQFNIADMS